MIMIVIVKTVQILDGNTSYTGTLKKFMLFQIQSLSMVSTFYTKSWHKLTEKFIRFRR